MSTNIVSTLDGLFKRVYTSKGVENLIPENVKLVNLVPFQAADRLGDSFRQPVVVADEQGYSYGGSDGTAFALNASIATRTKDANVKGYESLMRSTIAYAVASRSATSEAAFEQGTKLIVASLLRSFAKRLEISMLYGQKEIGLVNANTSSSNSFVISEASWAPGIWNGVEGAKVEVYSADLGTDRTSNPRVINSVNIKTRTITLSGAALSLTAGDRVLFEGAYTGTAWAECLGLHGIMSAFEDGVTDLFGINPASYNVWRSTVVSAKSADLSFEKIQEAIAEGAGRGLDEDVVCMVSMKTWAKLCADQASLRVYDSSFKRTALENGGEAITFFGQTGMVEIVPSAYMKQSLAMIMPKKGILSRIGSTDVTFKLPGSDNDKFFRELNDNAGYEIRAYSDQALFCAAPNKLILINNIVNS